MTEREQILNRLSLGIKGICRTKRSRRRTALMLLSVLLILSLAVSVPLVIHHFTPEPPAPQWEGRMVILCGNENVYNNLFYKLYPKLLPSFDITKASFEEKMNVTLCRKSAYKEMVTHYGLKEYLDPETLPPLNRTFYVILLDENQVPLYLGTDQAQLLEVLRPILEVLMEGDLP